MIKLHGTGPLFRTLAISTMWLLLQFPVLAQRAAEPGPVAITYKVATPRPQYPESAILQPVDLGASMPGLKPIRGRLGITRISDDAPFHGASAKPGDFLLQNENITVIISDPKHAPGAAVSGGYVIDAFTNQHPADQLDQLHLYLNDKYPRMARFNQARIVEDGSSTAAVVLEVSGTDSEDPSIDVVSTYTLTSKSNMLEIKTAVTPREKPLKEFILGDAFAWGETDQFIPGEGFGKTAGRFAAPWIGGQATGVAYGLFMRSGDLWGPIGSNWIDPNGTTVTLEIDEPGMYVRFFAVARDLAEIARIAQEYRGEPAYPVTGTVRESDTNYSADGVRITASSNGAPYTMALSRNGRFRLDLPPGEYEISAQDRIRTVHTDPVNVSVPQPETTLTVFQVAPPAVARLVTRDSSSGRALPAKVIFMGRNGTPDPDLGPPHKRISRNAVNIHTGNERIAVPAGDYEVVVARGIEYDITTHSVTLNPNTELTIRTDLKRVIDLPQYISGDFHQHMRNSPDSAIPLEDRVISSVCEGLQLIVATDHNYVTDLAPVIRQLRLEQWIKSVIGDEITPRLHYFGHFNAFPLQTDPARKGNGAIQFEKTYASKVFDESHSHPGQQVIQVNHPRSGNIGYFSTLDLSPEDGTTTHPNWSDKFTAIEVFNGKRLSQLEETLPDWFNLLNLGYSFAATGNSDSHRVYDQEAGYPRNYVNMGGVRPNEIRDEALVAAVNQNRLFVTNGPILSFTTEQGTDVGSSETLTNAPVRFRARIEGANFVQPSQAELYRNGELIETISFAETSSTLKWEGVLSDEPHQDSWYVLLARGSRSLWPVVSISNAGRGLTPQPLAFTNPIWIDRDGDGAFTAINEAKLPMMQENRTADAAASLDEMTSRSQNRQFARPRVRLRATPSPGDAATTPASP